MNFELSEEQSALQDGLRRLLADRYGFERRREWAASAAGYDEQTWRTLGEMGVTALLVPPSYGGIGGGASELFVVMESLGAALSLEPFLGSCVLGATAVHLAASEPICRELLPVVAAGELRLAWAHDEAAGRHAACWTETRALHQGSAWRLQGRKLNVLGAVFAQHFVVSARVNGAPDDGAGRALFLVSSQGEGVHARHHRLVDDSCASEITLHDAPAIPLGDPMDGERAAKAIDSTLALGMAALCADMVGAMGAAFKLARDYLNTRRQFGRLIGENQALRHRAAEMLVSLEMARSMAMAAAVAVDDPASEGAALDLHRAKLSVARHARLVAHGAIQLHGGIGMTEEYAVGHYLRRIHVMDQLLGDGASHAARLADLMLA